MKKLPTIAMATFLALASTWALAQVGGQGGTGGSRAARPVVPAALHLLAERPMGVHLHLQPGPPRGLALVVQTAPPILPAHLAAETPGWIPE